MRDLGCMCLNTLLLLGFDLEKFVVELSNLSFCFLLFADNFFVSVRKERTKYHIQSHVHRHIMGLPIE